MATYRVILDFSSVLNATDATQGRAIAKISNGIERAALRIQEQWQNAVIKAPGIGQPQRQAYVDSIIWRWVNGNHTAAVVETNLPIASEIENGKPARDLKRMLNTSPKVRDSKKGRYLIIPFQHNTTGNTAHAPAMPRRINQQAARLSKSTITGTGARLSGTGAYDIKTKKRLTVAQNSYAWGGRLPAGLAPKKAAHHSTDIYAGMTRFNTSTGKSKSSAYMTFRIMGEWQTSKWVVPAKPGLFIARTIAQNVNKAIKDAMGG